MGRDRDQTGRTRSRPWGQGVWGVAFQQRNREPPGLEDRQQAGNHVKGLGLHPKHGGGKGVPPPPHSSKRAFWWLPREAVAGTLWGLACCATAVLTMARVQIYLVPGSGRDPFETREWMENSPEPGQHRLIQCEGSC